MRCLRRSAAAGAQALLLGGLRQGGRAQARQSRNTGTGASAAASRARVHGLWPGIYRPHQEQALPGVPAGRQQAAQRRVQTAQARRTRPGNRQHRSVRGLRQAVHRGERAAEVVQGLRAGADAQKQQRDLPRVEPGDIQRPAAARGKKRWAQKQTCAACVRAVRQRVCTPGRGKILLPGVQDRGKESIRPRIQDDQEKQR